MRNMRSSILSLVALIIVATTLFTFTGAAQAKAASDLTGVWTCNDGGTYYLRQTSSTLMWYGENNPNNPSFSNVARGTINGNTINLVWMDVPKSPKMNSGILKLSIASDNELQAVYKTGGFSGSDWTR
jgi:hypothetical protein